MIDENKFECTLDREDLDQFLTQRSGTVLDCFCPLCGADLVQSKDLVLKIVNFEGKEGEIRMSPILNVFDLESTITLQDQKEDEDLICPHCNGSLIIKDDSCDDCGSKTAMILVSAYSQKVPFYICMRTGCHWHGFKQEDKEKILLDDSDEW